MQRDKKAKKQLGKYNVVPVGSSYRPSVLGIDLPGSGQKQKFSKQYLLVPCTIALNGLSSGPRDETRLSFPTSC